MFGGSGSGQVSSSCPLTRTLDLLLPPVFSLMINFWTPVCRPAKSLYLYPLVPIWVDNEAFGGTTSERTAHRSHRRQVAYVAPAGFALVCVVSWPLIHLKMNLSLVVAGVVLDQHQRLGRGAGTHLRCRLAEVVVDLDRHVIDERRIGGIGNGQCHTEVVRVDVSGGPRLAPQHAGARVDLPPRRRGPGRYQIAGFRADYAAFDDAQSGLLDRAQSRAPLDADLDTLNERGAGMLKPKLVALRYCVEPPPGTACA